MMVKLVIFSTGYLIFCIFNKTRKRASDCVPAIIPQELTFVKSDDIFYIICNHPAPHNQRKKPNRELAHEAVFL